MKSSFLLGGCGVWLAAARVGGCDLCAVYNANGARGEGTTGFRLALAEQFTHSGTLQEEGSQVADPIGQYRDSSITSFIVGYNFTPRWGVSVNIPYIHRTFKRAEGFAVDRGTESGLGDLSLIGNWTALLRAEHDYSYSINLLGGVEFPTGNSDRLREEVNETDTPGAPPSGVHGNDLALGSGSFDGIVGISGNARWRRWLFGVETQYFIRSTGDFEYRFGNEISITGGPGFYLLFDENRTLSFSTVFGYENKAKDSLDGLKRDDGISTAWYGGPGFTLTWGEHFSATLNADLPLRIDNRAFQTVPDYRVRGGVAWHF